MIKHKWRDRHEYFDHRGWKGAGWGARTYIAKKGTCDGYRIRRTDGVWLYPLCLEQALKRCSWALRNFKSLSEPEMNFTKELLISRAWGFGSEATDNNVEAYIFFFAQKTALFESACLWQILPQRQKPQHTLRLWLGYYERNGREIKRQNYRPKRGRGYGIYSIFHLRKIPAYAWIFK